MPGANFERTNRKYSHGAEIYKCIICGVETELCGTGPHARSHLNCQHESRASRAAESKEKADNSAMRPCPKYHRGGKCHGNPWRQLCGSEHCMVAQPQ